MDMVQIDADAVRKAIQKRGYSYSEVAAELSYGAENSLYNAIKRGRMPAGRFQKLVKMVHVPESELLKKEEKPVQESLNLDYNGVQSELKEIKQALVCVANNLQAIYESMERWLNEDGSNL